MSELDEFANPYPVPRPRTEVTFPIDPRAFVWYEGYEAGLLAALEAAQRRIRSDRLTSVSGDVPFDLGYSEALNDVLTLIETLKQEASDE